MRKPDRIDMRILDEKWTPAQRDCIRSRGETLLVSAAAGSGKTAVLTERIIDRVLQEDDPIELSTLLVVTFTKAAAAELKTRIRDALTAELVRNPEARHLRDQLLAVGQAKICTIDSFCYELIRSHAEELGLSANTSVSDEAQAKLLAKTVMEDCINDSFDGHAEAGETLPQNFGAVSDLLVSARASESLSEVLLSLYGTLCGYPEGTEWIAARAEELKACAEKDFFAPDNPYGARLVSVLRAWIAESVARYADALDIVQSDALFVKNYGDGFSYTADWICRVRETLADGDYDTVRGLFLSFDMPALKSGIRGEKKTEDCIRAKEIHDRFQEERKKYTERFFGMSADEIRLTEEKQTEILSALYTFMKLFETRLWAEKCRKKTVEFSDLGRLALRLLWDAEAQKPTALAVSEAGKYREIYIDEYQDVSPVQDLLFTCLSKKDNRFMVGDPKQSIYGFRGATPSVFADYRRRFANGSGEGRTVFLSDNFRCDRQVIAFSNVIFSVLFGCGTHSVPYTEDDALVCSKPVTGEDRQTKVSVAVLSSAYADEDGGEDAEGDADEPHAADGYTEEDYIADRIARLLADGKKRDGTPLRPHDIAILLRSASKSAVPIAEALSGRHIPSYNTVTRGFFENSEVLLMYSLLVVIDNPQKDVFLAGVLKSPLYRVTLDELIHIRRTHPDGSLYDALRAFVDETGFKKGKFFLEKLAYYRYMASGMPCDRFVWMVYQDTGILSLVYEKERDGDTEAFADTDAVTMRANLMMFYEYARTFSEGAFGGLLGFVLFIGDVIEEKAKLPTVQLSGEESDTVRIMTVHQSKGLEFPVVFVAGLGRKHNTADQRKSVLIDTDAGIATYVALDGVLARIDHPVRECVRMTIAGKQAEEEMRVLYVALTRAREQLYLSGTVKDADAFTENCAANARFLSPSVLSAQPTMLDWILTALYANPAFDGADVIFPTASDAVSASSSDETGNGSGDSAENEKISYQEAKRLVEQRLSFVYPDSIGTRLPAKLSVSALKDGLHLLRNADAENTVLPEAESGAETEKPYSRPRFLSAEGEHATAAQRGVATHMFMQFCDYARLSADALEDEILRLQTAKFLDAETAARIDRRTLRRFIGGALFARLRGAREIHREMRFNLYVPVSACLAKEEAALLNGSDADTSVLVQGIMDCYFTDADGKTVLVDYKTDHFTKEQCENPAGAEAILRARHGGQLRYYRAAFEAMTGREPDEVRIYSFALGYDFIV